MRPNKAIALIAIVPAGLLTSSIAAAQSQKGPCAQRGAEIVGSIEGVFPEGGSVSIRSGTVARTVNLGACLFAGDVITQPQNVRQIKLFDGEAFVTWPRTRGPYRVKASPPATLASWGHYITDLVSRVWGGSASVARDRRTGVRGPGDGAEAVLASSPADQDFAPSLSGGDMILAWNGADNNIAPCALGATKGSVDYEQGMLICRIAATDMSDMSTLRIEKRFPGRSWDLHSVSANEIPRPDWIAPGAPLSSSMRASWGAWLLDHPKKYERYQLLGLSMLLAERNRGWLQRYLAKALF